jgi:uncharacterized repeat protein (TIGR01451 family)
MEKRQRQAGRVLLGLLVLVISIPAVLGQMNGRQPAPPSAGEPPLAVPRGAPFGTTGPAGPASPGDPPTPQVAIRVRVPALAHPNKELEYRILVQNPTTASAHHVRVRAPVPSHCNLVRANPEPTSKDSVQMIWELGTMEGGANKEITLVVVPTGAGEPQCCARVQFEHGECVKTKLTQPDLRVRLLGPTQVLLNDLPKYQIEVTNIGQREAADVQLSNTLPEGLEFINSKPSTKGDNPLTWHLGTIPVGEKKQVEVEVLAKAIGNHVNKAVARDSTGQKEATLKLSVVEPKVEMSLTGPQQRLFGRPAQYQITVSNPGTAPASNVEVRSTIPPQVQSQVQFLSASAGGSWTAGELRWKVGTIPPGGQQTLQATFQARQPGLFIFNVVASADRINQVGQKFNTNFLGASNLLTEIAKHPDPIEVGKVGTYTLRVINHGSAPANDLKATLTLPDELNITEVNGEVKNEAKGPVLARREGQKVIADLPVLISSGEATVTVKAQAVKAGEVRLRGEVTARELTSGPIHVEESATLHSESPVPPPIRPPG